MTTTVDAPTGAPVDERPHGVVTASSPMALVLCALTIFGPISMDLYLPVLPALTADLGATTSAAQLTVTACLIGLALGQLVAGPLSDRFGRRRPLLIGVAAFVVASLLCAVAPTVTALVVARFVQGLAGAVGIVIAQAAGRDLYTGSRLLRYYGRLTVLGGLAAVVGPVVGGQLARVTDWRGTFVFLALLGLVLLVASAALLRETLPESRRRGGGVVESVSSMGHLLRDRKLVAAVLVTGLSNAALFAYLSGATFVLQDIYGLTPQGYSYAFALNSAGFMVFGFLGSRVADLWSVRGTLVVGLALVLIGSVGVLATALGDLPLAAMVVSLFLLVSGVATSTPPATTLALEDHPEQAGAAAALLGSARFAFGGVTAPVVGIAGAATAVPLGVVVTVAAVLAGAACLLLPRTSTRAATREVIGAAA
ncbi:multidrug effflux MFS transporter [Nocardioides marmoraquaticus]